MQCVGETPDVYVYDDYAHHPTAVRLSIAAMRESHKDAFLAVAFQPHTFSRAETMFDAFVDALSGSRADFIVVTSVFDARPKERGNTQKERGDAKVRGGNVAVDVAARAGGAFAATEDEAVDSVVAAVRVALGSATRTDGGTKSHPRGGNKKVVVLCLGAGAGFDVARQVFARLENA
jgi:UDP-N-acetylmuramate-alanine ligase